MPLDNRGSFVKRLLEALVTWAQGEVSLRGLALIGSYARGEAREDSDVDVIALVENPQNFCTMNWLNDINWRLLESYPSSCWIAQYGIVWSKHVQLDNNVELELSFAPLSWTSTRLVHAGTRRVISDGFQILYDPDKLLHAVCAHLRNG